MAWIGRAALSLFAEVGRLGIYAGQVIGAALTPPVQRSAISVRMKSRCTQMVFMTQYWAERYSRS